MLKINDEQNSKVIELTHNNSWIHWAMLYNRQNTLTAYLLSNKTLKENMTESIIVKLKHYIVFSTLYFNIYYSRPMHPMHLMLCFVRLQFLWSSCKCRQQVRDADRLHYWNFTESVHLSCTNSTVAIIHVVRCAVSFCVKIHFDIFVLMRSGLCIIYPHQFQS